MKQLSKEFGKELKLLGKTFEVQEKRAVVNSKVYGKNLYEFHIHTFFPNTHLSY